VARLTSKRKLSQIARLGGVGLREIQYSRAANWKHCPWRVDESKAHLPDFRHRALRHHTEGIFLAERIFSVTVFNFRRTTDGMSVVLKLGFWRDSLWFGGSTFSIYG